MTGPDNPQNPEIVASAVKAKASNGASQQGTAAATAKAKKKDKKASTKRKK